VLAVKVIVVPVTAAGISIATTCKPERLIASLVVPDEAIVPVITSG
jgi:hypothetical protein